MKPFSARNRAFTLIEMLAVIGIIALLVALLFPAIKSSLMKSEVTRAQSGISNLSTAFRAYYTEYGKWPISDTTVGQRYVVDANMVALLSAGSITAGAIPTIEMNGAISGSSGQFQGNPRNIVFLQFKQSELGAAPPYLGYYLDPWKKPYFFSFDVTYVNNIPNPFAAQYITNGFIVWSDGPDGQESQSCGDPPGPYSTTPCVNSDNVKSW